MAGNVSIETIVPCREEETFHESVRCYLQALVSIGIGEATLLEWGQELRWPEPGERVDTAWPYMRLKAQDESFTTQLRLYRWVEDDESSDKLILSLVFDMEEVIGPGAPFNPNLMYYKRSFGQLAWRIMREISKYVSGYGCYLEDEASQGLLVAMGSEEKKAFWNVSLGIASREIYEGYLPVPENIVTHRRDEVGIFALRWHWDVLPWEE
jgi:hypothetical protein